MNTTLEIETAAVPQTSDRQALELKKILVPLDFSPASLHAFRYTLALAEEFGAEIHLVHVQPTDEFSAVHGAGHLMLNCADAIALMQDRLSEARGNRGARFWPENCHVVSGRPYQEIARLAREIGVDLVVLPTRGQSALKRIALGSTAERLVRIAPCPVLIPRGPKFEAMTWSGDPTRKFKIRRMLAPVDFSECSLVGLRYASQLARRFKAQLRLVHVVFPYTQLFQMDRIGSAATPLVGSARRQAEEEMRRLRQLDFLQGVNCETSVRVGPAIDEICAESAESGVDLVVTSTHGRTGLRHAVVGSTAEHLVRYAETPVLVVPSRQKPDR